MPRDIMVECAFMNKVVVSLNPVHVISKKFAYPYAMEVDCPYHSHLGCLHHKQLFLINIFENLLTNVSNVSLINGTIGASVWKPFKNI